MANINNYNYQSFDRPYNTFMERSTETGAFDEAAESLIGNPQEGINGFMQADVPITISNPSQVLPGALNGASLTDTWIETWIKSRSYLPKTAGFYIDGRTGYIECRDFYSGNATIAGTITATAGFIGGWTISATSIYSTGVTLSSAGDAYISFGTTPPTSPTTGTGIFINKTGLYGLSAGVQKFNISAVDGSITSVSGTIGGWTIGATTISSSTIILDSAGTSVRSNNYVGGLSGFYLNDVYAEFGNVTVRGSIKSSIMEYDQVSVTAGTRGVYKSAGKLLNTFASVAAPTTFNIDIEDPDSGHYQLFAAADILRIKEGSLDNWFTVQSVTDMTTYYRYVCVLSHGTAATTFTSGASVIDYGGANHGLIYETADDAHSPKYIVAKHSGSPWTDIDAKVILGNLWDKTGVDEYGLWVKGESVYLGGYKLYDAIASKNGTDTVVYYNGAEYASIKAAVDAAEAAAATKITIFVRNGAYTEIENAADRYADGWDIDVYLIGEDKENTIITFSSTNWGWKFDRKVSIINIQMISSELIGPIIHDSTTYPYFNLTNSIIRNTNTTNTSGLRSAVYFHGGTSGGEYRIYQNKIYCENPNINSDGSLGAIFFNGLQDNVIIQNNYIKTGIGAIYFNDFTNDGSATVEDNEIEVLGHATNTIPIAIKMEDSIVDGKVVGNKIININSGTKFSYGILWLGNTSVVQRQKVTDNIIVGADIGMRLQGVALQCSNNIVSDCATCGIYVIGGYYNSNDAMAVTGNVISNCTSSSGGAIQTAYANFSFQNNIIFNCYNAFYDGDYRTSNINISNNYIRKCTNGINFRGYSFSFGGSGFIYCNNHIVADSSSYGTYGIVLGSYHDQTVISNNVILYYQYGIFSNPRIVGAGSRDVYVQNNIIRYITTLSIDFSTNGGVSGEIKNNYLEKGVLTTGQTYSFSGNTSDGPFTSTSGFPMFFESNRLSANTAHTVSTTSNIGNSRISDNYIEAGPGYNCIHTSGDISNTHIISNQFYAGSTTSRNIHVGGDVETCTISNNIFDGVDTDQYMIYVTGSMDRITSTHFIGSIISNNIFTGRSTSHAQTAIFVGVSMGDTIVNANRFFLGNNGSTRHAIDVIVDAAYCIFTSNRISNNVFVGTTDGFYIAGTSTGNVFANNILT